MKKLLQWLAVAVFAVLVFVPGTAQAQTVPVQLTSFQVTNLEKQPVNSVGLHSKFYMNINWDASGQELHNGDSFDIELPTFLRFPDDAATSFNLYTPDGEVCAVAEINPLTQTCHVTFTNYVEGKDNIKGSIWLATWIGEDNGLDHEELRIVQTSTGQVATFTVHTERPNVLTGEVIAKWGVADTDADTIEWKVRLNVNQMNLTNVILEDSIEAGSYVPGSFKLYRVRMDEYGAIDDSYGWNPVQVDEPTINGSTFTLNLHNAMANGEQYFLIYRTTKNPRIKNSITLYSAEKQASSVWTYVAADSGGNGNGDNRPQPTEPETPPTPEPAPTPQPNPGPQPQPTPEETEPEPQPKPEPTKPVKKVKKAKKAALPATGDDAVIAVAAGVGAIALAFIITSRFVRKKD